MNLNVLIPSRIFFFKKNTGLSQEEQFKVYMINLMDCPEVHHSALVTLKLRTMILAGVQLLANMLIPLNLSWTLHLLCSAKTKKKSLEILSIPSMAINTVGILIFFSFKRDPWGPLQGGFSFVMQNRQPESSPAWQESGCKHLRDEQKSPGRVKPSVRWNKPKRYP